jgi:hypothetical protein
MSVAKIDKELNRKNLISFLENKDIKYTLDSDGEITEIHGDLNLYEYNYEFTAPSLKSIKSSLDLGGYEHEFIAPNLISIGGYLYLYEYNYEFSAPNLKSVEGSLYLYDYNYEFIAPNLISIGGYLDLRKYKHEFNTPLLKSIKRYLDLEDYKHDFKAPNLESIGGYLALEKYKHEFTALNLKSIGGGLGLCGYNYKFIAPLLKDIYDVYLENDKIYNLCSREYKGINIDSVNSILISEKTSKEGFTIRKCREPVFEDKELVGDVHYIVSKDSINAHGDTVKEAMKDYSFKLQEREGTDKYKELKLETVKPLDYWITCYRTITGACKYGVNEFLNSINKKEFYSLSEVIALTENQYGHESFKGFFNKNK